MTLLYKCIINNAIIQNSNRICLSSSCLFRSIHLSKRKFAWPNLRHYTSNTIKAKVVENAGKNVNSAIGKKGESELRRLFALAAPEKWKLTGAVAFLMVSSSVTMVVPFCLGKIIDLIYSPDSEKTKENLNRVCLTLLGVFIIGAICNFSRIYLMSTSGHRITRSLRRKVYSAIIRQETAMFDKVSTGELVGRLAGDAQLVSSSITSNVSDGLRSTIMTTVGMSMMVYVSPQLSLVGLFVIPPVAGLAILYNRFVKKNSKDVQDNLASLSTTAEEKISNIRTVKAFAQEVNEIKKYNDKLQDLLTLCYRESLFRGLFFGMTNFSGNIIILSVLYYGGFMLSDARITVGSLSAFLIYAGYVGFSISGVSSFYSELNKALGASTRLFDLINRQPTIPIEGGRILDQELSGDVRFENINFAYPTRNASWILNDFNLHLPKSSITAIVGPSGSGKSTLALLLLRLYDPDRGAILLDGHDLRSLDPIWVKSFLSVVPQEPTLFNDTIRENIIYGANDVSEKDIVEASKISNVLEFVNRLPNGLDTLVGERGITLSGGQRQRVAIARALIKNPRILILDEATSALDAESEHLVQEALERASRGRTVLTIAHRLSTIKNADQIAVLDQGRIIETGTYNELIALEEGFFKKLIKHQTFS